MGGGIMGQGLCISGRHFDDRIHNPKLNNVHDQRESIHHSAVSIAHVDGTRQKTYISMTKMTWYL